MSRQPHEVLGDDPESVIDLYAVPPSVIPIRPAKPRPLAQVEVLVLFHPLMQSGHASADTCGKAAQGWLTLDVHGRIGTSELSGLPVIENMRLEACGEDIEALLPDSVVNEIVRYVTDEN